MSEDAIVVEDKTRALRAALLLARIVVANTANSEFMFEENDLACDQAGMVLVYEGMNIRLVDMLSGSLMLLRGLVADLADAEEVEAVQVARVIELSAAMCDAVGSPEAF